MGPLLGRSRTVRVRPALPPPPLTRNEAAAGVRREHAPKCNKWCGAVRQATNAGRCGLRRGEPEHRALPENSPARVRSVCCSAPASSASTGWRSQEGKSSFCRSRRTDVTRQKQRHHRSATRHTVTAATTDLGSRWVGHAAIARLQARQPCLAWVCGRFAAGLFRPSCLLGTSEGGSPRWPASRGSSSQSGEQSPADASG